MPLALSNEVPDKIDLKWLSIMYLFSSLFVFVSRFPWSGMHTANKSQYQKP